MALTSRAERSESTYAALLQFAEYVPEHHVEINAAASELANLKAEIHKLRNALLTRLDHRRPDVIRQREILEKDQDLLFRSFDHTLRDIKRLCGRLSDPVYRSQLQAYRGVWKNIDQFFGEESNNPLSHRLICFREFLQEIVHIHEGGDPSPKFSRLRHAIERLLEKQVSSLTIGITQLGFATPKKSFERVRPDRAGNISPLGFETHHDQMPHERNESRGPRRGDFSPFSPISPGLEYEEDYFVFAPEVPDSPTSSMTTPSLVSSNTSTTTGPEMHWVQEVFKQPRPSTRFKISGSESGCFGEHMPGASSKMRDASYDQILKLPLEEGQVEVRFFIREADARARILIRQEPGMERNTRRAHKQSCLPLTSLRVIRRDSCLQLCTAHTHKNELRLWALLRFPNYERMVLFHCIFLGLKAQDGNNNAARLEDTELHGEVTVLKAIIIDDNFQHVLQVIKERDSGGVRLLASARDGPLKRAPIWTAFITYVMGSRNWLRLHERRKVHLSDLTRYVFTDDYEMQTGPAGEHELFFEDAADAREFIKVVGDVEQGIIP